MIVLPFLSYYPFNIFISLGEAPHLVFSFFTVTNFSNFIIRVTFKNKLHVIGAPLVSKWMAIKVIKVSSAR